MVERPYDGPLPPAHPQAGQIADGQLVHRDPGPPLPRRRWWPGLLCAGIVLALMFAGIAGWRP